MVPVTTEISYLNTKITKNKDYISQQKLGKTIGHFRLDRTAGGKPYKPGMSN